jgi:hypothetical protein
MQLSAGGQSIPRNCTSKLNVWIEPADMERLKLLAKANGTSVSCLTRILLKQSLQQCFTEVA